MLERIFITIATSLLCLLGLAAFATPAAAQQCASPKVTCGGSCVDTRSDDKNCGACGVTCEHAYGCSQGTCKLECPEAQLVCGKRCVTPANNPDHCGGCGKPCAHDEYCSGGACKSVGVTPTNSCPAYLKMCGGLCRDVKVDRSHCGGCGTQCGVSALCIDGKCIEASCSIIQKVDTAKKVQQNVQPIQPRKDVRRK